MQITPHVRRQRGEPARGAPVRESGLEAVGVGRVVDDGGDEGGGRGGDEDGEDGGRGQGGGEGVGEGAEGEEDGRVGGEGGDAGEGGTERERGEMNVLVMKWTGLKDRGIFGGRSALLLEELLEEELE